MTAGRVGAAIARLRTRRVRRVLVAGALLTASPPLVLWGASFTRDVPAELTGARPAGAPADRNSVRVVDRAGVLLYEARDEEGKRQRELPLSELGERVPKAVIAAEDSRFYEHSGVDVLALLRAGVDSARQARVASGASTLTQQLARTTMKTPRTVRGKLDVMATALAIERALSKDQILEAYLNRVEFGPNVEGVEAAAHVYFDKSARSLSLAEAATLAAIPRGPTLYDPTKRPEIVKRRRDRVLDRMLDHGLADAEEVRIAKGEELVVGARFSAGSAPHLARAVLSGRVDPCAQAVLPPDGTVEIRTTLLSDLEREITVASRRVVDELSDQGVSAAAVLVIDNRSGAILAYVGSPDDRDSVRLGQNDGVRAKRQPGSALKPFLYELAFERAGLTPASMIPDVPLSFPTASGDPYRPENYDHRFHGPVRVRQALGNSYNVPAVVVADRLGPAQLLERLRALGMCSLDQSADRYGLGLALGDGEISLLELARAYSALARGGESAPLHVVEAYALADGSVRAHVAPPSQPVLDADATALVVDVLRDKSARTASFGEGTVFDLPFEVAAKTGTSKGFRDNLAVGFTNELTVAVWVGNFDGSPMRGVSGISGAGPLFRESMLAASRYVEPTPFAAPLHAERRAICPLSGGKPTSACSHTVEEWIPAHAELEDCAMHERVPVDRISGQLARAECPGVVERTFERFPPVLRAWAVGAGRPLAPTSSSATCPARRSERVEAPTLTYPEPQARFYLDGRGPTHVTLRAMFPRGGGAFRVDGRAVTADDRGVATVALGAGTHTVVAVARGEESASVTFSVE